MGPGSRALCMMPDRDLTRLEGLAPTVWTFTSRSSSYANSAEIGQLTWLQQPE